MFSDASGGFVYAGSLLQQSSTAIARVRVSKGDAASPRTTRVPDQSGASIAAPVRYEIQRLPTLRLRLPLRALLRIDDGAFLAEAIDFPLYGSGDTELEAKEMLEREIESLWDDLNSGGDFSPQWEPLRKRLKRAIAHE